MTSNKTCEDAATQSRLVLSLRSLLEPLAADRLRVSWRLQQFRVLGFGFRV